MKKILACFVAIVFMLSITHTANATSNNYPQLTDEQKAEMVKQYEAKYKEAQEKFNTLTDEQKKELYDLYDKINITKLQLLDKYVEFGLISKEEADIIRTQMGAKAQEIRDGKQFIGFGGMRLHKSKTSEQINDGKTEVENTEETSDPKKQ